MDLENQSFANINYSLSRQITEDLTNELKNGRTVKHNNIKLNNQDEGLIQLMIN